MPVPHRRLLAAASLAVAMLAPHAHAQQAMATAPQPRHEVIAPEDLALFSRVVDQVARHYVDPRDGHELVLAALRSLMKSLDPHSVLIENVSPQSLRDSLVGEFGGVGVELEIAGDAAVVMQAYPDAPAARAGIRVGDRIVAVDGQAVAQRPLDAVIASIKGPPRTQVRLGIRRNDQRFDVTVERQLVRFQTVTLEPSEGVAIVRIAEFVDTTPAELLEQLAKAQQQGPLRGVVLDLRGNPGGVVEAGVGVVSVFMPSNVLVLTSRGREPEPPQPYLTSDAFNAAARWATPELRDALRAVPLVVLVDHRSASSSEIVAAALQDHGRARVVGCGPTFGKGSIQSIVPLTTRYAVKLTTARFSSPRGRALDGVGVMPDVVPTSPLRATGGASSAASSCEQDGAGVLLAARRELERLASTASNAGTVRAGGS